MAIKRLIAGSLWCGLVIFSKGVFCATIDQQRQDFLLAEKLVELGDELGFLSLSANLADYPLYPYLQYQWLKNNLAQTDKVLAFLSSFKDTRYAELLRNKWLAYLADNGRWQDFVQNYQATGDTALECQFYWANFQLGKQQPALDAAKRLWLVGDTQPKECAPLLSALVLSPVMTPDLIWQRLDLALAKDNTYLAKYLQGLLDKPGQALAATWLQVHKKPDLIQDSQWWVGDAQQGRIFAHGVDRLAKTNLDLAISIWDTRKPTLSIDQATVQKLERRLGLALARARDYRAYARLNKVLEPDAEVREWKVRAALLALNWPQVATALAGLTQTEQQQPQWQYWQARALSETGHVQQGQSIFQQLSADRSYYGFMAADAVNKPYSVIDKPVFLPGNELAGLAQQTDFRVAQELSLLNREAEAKRQWWFSVKKLSKAQLLVAAKLAQQWQWQQVAIITLVKADYWDDLGLRFPVSYNPQVQANASLQGLDPAIIFGLMRQESMLDKEAQSAAGARGLMQLMPATGQQMASALNEPWQSDSLLFDPDLNIKYGSFYYKQLLARFDGHVALAAAAYNAGPYRVDKWLPVAKAMPADVWIETIPYKETRKYVSSVLSYAIIYQQRLQRNALKLAQLLTEVRPH
ncbi:MAG: transglycosylase SLT domain-containing protein [Methylococcales bacterium]|nr:transglycosylase SLT domain-containing protein [Methylococcales bacterium]